MAGESSFDVVSDFDDQEMRNALDQVRREVQQRYDFKGATFELTQTTTELVLLTDDEFRAKAIRDLIESQGGPAQPVAQDLRLGQARAGRREQGPPAHQPCGEAWTRIWRAS